MIEVVKTNSALTKDEIYQSLAPQINALVGHEQNRTANQANLCAVLKEIFNWFWVGFYLVDGDELVLGPFQGPVACTRIPKGKGVCGEVMVSEEATVIPDVHNYPNHIACSPLSKSEIVLPFWDENNVLRGVLDIDSEIIDCFDQTDKDALASILEKLKGKI